MRSLVNLSSQIHRRSLSTRLRLLSAPVTVSHSHSRPAIFRSFGRMAFLGPVQQHIEKTLQEALNPTYLQITNESHGRKEDESHFHVLVVSKVFEENKSLIEKHRRVQSLFTDEEGKLKFHSLRITAKTPEQWEKSNKVQAAPKCTGKGDGRAPTDVTKL
uniref:BolA-like protein n=1 Tax=Aplanochytrium stocchinoi TaxID=215587 RepID=A0A7S3V1W0_9STRA|mmetsp:Transcript_12458/g.15462  ORF Transcript_12458/g.15462 Transcript_12458/m.15462 type:complete len:160 (+) Transcript_12458:177-656(+)